MDHLGKSTPQNHREIYIYIFFLKSQHLGIWTLFFQVNMDVLGEPETPEEAILGETAVRATRNGWIRIVVHKGKLAHN